MSMQVQFGTERKPLCGYVCSRTAIVEVVVVLKQIETIAQYALLQVLSALYLFLYDNSFLFLYSWLCYHQILCITVTHQFLFLHVEHA
jgi:hypothetical protein